MVSKNCKKVEYFEIANILVRYLYEPRCEKTGLRGFRHKPGCAVTEVGERLEISDLDRKRVALSM